jgi:hypothetical protein
MSDKRVSQLTELTTVADDDLVYLVDISDTTDGSSGSSRKAQAKNVRGWPITAAETAATVTPTAYQYPPGDVRRYGATGDGSTDDSAALQNAIDACEGAEYPLVFEPNTSYAIATRLLTTGDIVIEGNGATLIPASSTNGFVVSPGADIASTTLSADAPINRNSITVTSATGFTAGALIKIVSNASWHINPDAESLYKGELHVVKTVSGTTVTLEGTLADNYDTGTETITVTVLASAECTIRDLNVIYASHTTATVGMQLGQCISSLVENVTIDGGATQGLNITSCYNAVVTNSNFYRSNRVSLGYGIQINGSYGTEVKGCNFLQCRRGVDVSGAWPSRYSHIHNNNFDGHGLQSDNGENFDDASAFGGHETSEHTLFSNNVITHMQYAVVLRGMNELVSNNYIYGDIKTGCIAINKAVNCTIDGNMYNPGLRPIKTLDLDGSDDDEYKAQYFVYLVEPVNLTGFWNITNNHCLDLQNAFLSINFTTAAQTLNNVYVVNNVVNMTGDDVNTTVNLVQKTFGAEDYTLAGSIIRNNVILPDTATYVPIQSNVTYTDSTTFTAADATPSVANGHMFKTDSGSLTITDLDDGIDGQEVTIISKGAVTYDTTGTNLTGSSVDIVTADGDVTRWVCDGGTTWRLIAFVDASVDNSAGA